MSRSVDPIEDLVLEIQEGNLCFTSVEDALKHFCHVEDLVGRCVCVCGVYLRVCTRVCGVLCGM
jgi:hypothetical protein